jgi:streptogramin lyase
MRPQIQSDSIRQEEPKPLSLSQKRKTGKSRGWHIVLIIGAILLGIGFLLGGLTLKWYGQFDISKAGDPTRSGAVTEYSFPYNVSGMAAGMTLGPDGNVWFTNYNMGRVGKITPKGEMTEYTLPSGSGPTYPDRSAQLIATGSDGNLWYAAQGKIVRISPHGTLLGEYPFPIQGMAASVVSGPDGNIWYGIADSIVKLTPAGEATTFRVSGSQPAVWALAAGPDGNVWFSVAIASTQNMHIGRITPTGTIQIFADQMPFWINGLTKGPDGNVWFIGQNSIGRISPSGEVKLFSSSISLDSTDAVITLGPDGNIWYAEGDNMGRITPAGKQMVFSLPHDNAGHIVSMTAGADGGVWYMYSLEEEMNIFAGIWGTRIARITP